MGIFILSCGIVVLQNQVICGIQKFSGNFNVVFLCYTVQCLYIILYGFEVFVPPLCPPPTWFNLSSKATLGSKESGSCREVQTRVNVSIFFSARMKTSSHCREVAISRGSNVLPRPYGGCGY